MAAWEGWNIYNWKSESIMKNLEQNATSSGTRVAHGSVSIRTNKK